MRSTTTLYGDVAGIGADSSHLDFLVQIQDACQHRVSKERRKEAENSLLAYL
jgi:hypothetical protein